jgi:hypothetical protein
MARRNDGNGAAPKRSRSLSISTIDGDHQPADGHCGDHFEVAQAARRQLRTTPNGSVAPRKLLEADDLLIDDAPEFPRQQQESRFRVADLLDALGDHPQIDEDRRRQADHKWRKGATFTNFLAASYELTKIDGNRLRARHPRWHDLLHMRRRASCMWKQLLLHQFLEQGCRPVGDGEADPHVDGGSPRSIR